jgi:hypothetical protein
MKPKRMGHPQVLRLRCASLRMTLFSFVELINKDNSNNKSEMRGSLRSATHDEAVSRFGRDDAL